MSSLTFCHPAISQFLIGVIFFVIDCKEPKAAQTAQIHQFFQFLNLICLYGYAFSWLTRMLLHEQKCEQRRYDQSAYKKCFPLQN